jgi:PAS domain S-box-containing protein
VSNYGAFILEMGGPVKIVDLAHRMIDFAANGRGSDIAVEFTGLRPGEKLHETLVAGGETALATEHPMIKLACVAEPVQPDDGGISALVDEGGVPLYFEENLAHLVALAERHASREKIIEGLATLLPSYRPFVWDTAESFPGTGGADTEDWSACHEPESPLPGRHEKEALGVFESGLDWSGLVGARLALGLERSEDAILITDRDSRIKYVNQAYEHLIGYAAAEVVGHCPAEFMGDDGLELQKLIRKEVGDRGAFTIRMRAPRKDGVEIEVEATFSPLRDREGLMVGAACVARATRPIPPPRR